jgi:Pretoxin HINT domain
MIHAVLLCCVIIGDGAKPADTPATDRVAYQALAGKAGKNATAHVQLALWCEIHGLAAERIKHLTLASTLDAKNPVAQGLLGLVAFQGKWAKPEQVDRDIQNDPEFQALFREYLDRRVRTPQKADAQLRLAAWCLEKGLQEEAVAHYYLVTRLDPSRDIAWIRLGYKKHKDRWFKPEALAAQKLDAERQKRANLYWKPRLERLREGLESNVETRRLKAERELYGVNDPRAIPQIAKILGHGTEQNQIVAIELLSQIEGPAASFWIAVLAIQSPSLKVAEQATRTLSRRDPRDVIGWLVTLIHKPYKYRLTPAQGPGTTAFLEVDGERFDLRRFYQFPVPDQRLVPLPNSTFGLTEVGANFGGSTNFFAGMARRAFAGTIFVPQTVPDFGTVEVESRLEDDVRALETANARNEQTNARALPLLESLTDQKFGPDGEDWRKWWTEQLGYVYDSGYSQSKPVHTDVVRPTPHTACFGAGTLVHTLGGPRTIESIKVGDRILAQNTTTGGLAYQPVLATHLNGPSQTLRIAIDGETVIATGIHRFWKAGTGWIMARELKAGDRVRIIGGIVSVQSVEPDATQMVYNLSVAADRDFLVGKAGLLVHDYSFVLPVSEPFDRQTNAGTPASK